MRVHDPSRALLDKPPTAAPHEKGGETAGRGGGTFAQIRKHFDTAGLAGFAMTADWTFVAAWLPRRTEQRAEFHEGLVEGRRGAGN